MWRTPHRRETDTGYHCGADVALLSQFAAEKEVLFPPATMLEVLNQAELQALKEAASTITAESPREKGKSVHKRGTMWGGAVQLKEEDLHSERDGKTFIDIPVRPTFV